MKSHILQVSLAFAILLCCVVSCSSPRSTDALDHVDSIIEIYPDSAMAILSGLDKKTLANDAQRAKYALLMSMALDKNYIDTTSFEVLQPAIDFYLKKGSPNEKLRTYYYQGIIYKNQGDLNNSMNSFIKALENSDRCTDSLVIARAYVAQAILFHAFHDFHAFTENNLMAAEIYNNAGKPYLEFDCLLNSLNGFVLQDNMHKADSIAAICKGFEGLNNYQTRLFNEHLLTYYTHKGSERDIRNIIQNSEEPLLSSINGCLNLALAYNKIGENDKAKMLLERVSDCGLEYDSLKYFSICVPVFENSGNYRDAFYAYKEFSSLLSIANQEKFDQKSKTIEEKRLIEQQAQRAVEHKQKIIWGCIAGIVILAMGIAILMLIVHGKRVENELAAERIKVNELENKRLKIERETLSQENSKLEVEKANLQSERDDKALEAEHLAQRVEMLESESTNLKRLMESQEDLPAEVRDVMKVRMEMLNSLLASHITANERYEKPYDEWVRDITENTTEFMNSNRLAFQASHPRFIQYLNDHGLTVEEINYSCLYAIGLRGTEVGNYMKRRSHVNTSSTIRKKLGIDKHETNIGIYLRRLLKSL